PEFGSPRFVFGPSVESPPRIVTVGQDDSDGQVLMLRSNDGTIASLIGVSVNTGTRGESSPGSLTAFGLAPPADGLVAYASGGPSPNVDLHLIDVDTLATCRFAF